MKVINPKSPEELYGSDDEQDTQKRQAISPRISRHTSTLERESGETITTTQNDNITDVPTPIETLDTVEIAATSTVKDEDEIEDIQEEGDQEEPIQHTHQPEVTNEDVFDPVQLGKTFFEAIETSKLISITNVTNHTDDQHEEEASPNASPRNTLEDLDTQQIASTPRTAASSPLPAVARSSSPQLKTLQKGSTLLLIALLCVIVLQAFAGGQGQFLGAQGWAYVLGGPTNTNDHNLLKDITGKGNSKPTPGATAQTGPMTPQQYINLIVQRMTLDQKLGQMMIVQFIGPAYSLDLNTMINQFGVGAVLIFSANQNIHDKAQLKGLIQQMQTNSTIPMAVAIDQEGGYVDRLVSLDGPRPSEASIGATNDPSKATAQGIQDAQDLSSYGINLNLAPVVDVTNVYNPQLYKRTYGNNPDLVTKMAMAYLQGLQQSGKVVGTLKHFPGLGDVGVDPHLGVPHLHRSLSDLERIDWAPYRTLIQQGNVHAIMVTHEIVEALDNSVPSSLSSKIVTGILRQQLGFQGVIMTDSLTMDSITAYYSESQAAAIAVEAGSDLLMGAGTASDVASMIQGIKQAMNNGDISQQRIDDSVRRILMMKYAMGLLHLPNN